MLILELKNTDQSEIISQAVKTLAAGGLVVFPTETIYGFLVDATNPTAVQKLLNLKKRRPGKAISIAVANQEMAEAYVVLNDQAKQIYQTLLPGPITVVSSIRADKKESLSKLISEFETLGIRIPDYPLLLELIKTFDRPVTATSANKFGGKNPYAIEDILGQFSEKQKEEMDLIIDAGQLPKRPPSVVIDTSQTTPICFRGNLENQNNADVKKDTEKIISRSPAETKLLAKKLLFRHFDQLEKGGLLIALDGELGVGKTVFTGGIAQYLNISADGLDSPTYTYIKEYDFDKNNLAGKLYHLDLWKINSAAELAYLELEKLQKPGNLIVIEWFDQIKDFAPELKPDLEISLTEMDDGSRQISIN